MKAYLVACIAAALAVPAMGQQPAPDTVLQIAGLEVWLGMPQDQALQRLSSAYDVRHADGMPGNWMIFRKGGYPRDLLGDVTFKDNRLSFAAKTWADSNVDSKNFAAAAYRALAALAMSAGRPCSIEFVERPVAVADVKCGRKTVRVVSPSDPKIAASVAEMIQ
jgi:hypothetical protein